MRVHYLRPLDYLPAGTVEDLPERLAQVLVDAGVVEVVGQRVGPRARETHPARLVDTVAPPENGCRE